mgnify:CR=1
MPVFEELTIVQYIPNYSTVRGYCDGVNPCDLGQNPPDCPSEAIAQAAEEACAGEWEWDLTYTKQIALKNIDLEIITSFESGRRAFDDPAGGYQKGDSYASETLITLAGAMSTQIIVDMSLVSFRTLMARNF